jgi:predicted flap endonuclease-1-like 5' DNA nuclease
MGFTANQWAILALVLVLGWLLGLLSRSGGSRWRRAYEEEHAAREAADARAAASRKRVVELERQVAGNPIGPGTATAVGAAAAGDRDDLALIRGIGRTRETTLNEDGIQRYRQIEALTDTDAATLETRLGLEQGAIAREQWREQATLLRSGRLEEHRQRYT